MYKIEAEREVGNSLRRTRVSWRWLVAVCALISDFEDVEGSGVRVMAHASPLRKRTFEEDALIVELDLVSTRSCDVADGLVEMRAPVERTWGRVASSHCVSHA